MLRGFVFPVVAFGDQLEEVGTLGAGQQGITRWKRQTAVEDDVPAVGRHHLGLFRLWHPDLPLELGVPRIVLDEQANHTIVRIPHRLDGK